VGSAPAPLAPDARTARVVNLARNTEGWAVHVDGAHVCGVSLSIDTREGGAFHIFTPDIPPDLLTPRWLYSGTFTRGPWWTPEILRSVLALIVRERIAPAASVTIEGVPPC